VRVSSETQTRHGAEKRTEQLPGIRVSERLEVALMRSAAQEGRELSDYIRRVLEINEFGRHGAPSVGDPLPACMQCNAAQCTARKAGQP